MNSVSTEIYDRLTIPDEQRAVSLRPEEGEFLYKLAKEKGAKNTLETGLAYGCSTAFIMSATQSNHIAIDPFQAFSFDNLGLQNIEKLGLSKNLRLVEEISCVALPKLLIEGVKIDFAFIDAGHRFDDIFIDFCYCDMMMASHGHVILHDAWMEATQRVASFIRTNRADYIEVSTHLVNLLAFRKIGEDTRPWDYHEPF